MIPLDIKNEIKRDWKEYIAAKDDEIASLKEALRGAAVIANHASELIKELRQDLADAHLIAKQNGDNMIAKSMELSDLQIKISNIQDAALPLSKFIENSERYWDWNGNGKYTLGQPFPDDFYAFFESAKIKMGDLRKLITEIGAA